MLRKALLVIILLALCVSPTAANIAFVASDSVVGSASGGTTPGMNDTGANLDILAVTKYASGTAITVSDNKSNSLTLTKCLPDPGALSEICIYYVLSPTVGSGHTFTVACTPNCYANLTVMAFSGVNTVFGLDQTSAGNTLSGGGVGATIQPGSITPGTSGSLVVDAVSAIITASSPSIDSGFSTPLFEPYNSGQNWGVVESYLIQGAAAPVNPTVTWNMSAAASFQVSFRATSLATAVPSLTVTGSGLFFPVNDNAMPANDNRRLLLIPGLR